MPSYRAVSSQILPLTYFQTLGIIRSTIKVVVTIPSLISSLKNDIRDPAACATDFKDFFSSLTSPQKPTTIEDIQDQVTKLYSDLDTTVSGSLYNLARLGWYSYFDVELDKSLGVTVTSGPPDDSSNNSNPIEPVIAIYPSQIGDAPYSVSEEKLRAALKIPNAFTYGQKQPVLLVHGTGQSGPQNFGPNIGKLLAATDYADPLWLNIPSKLNQDAQSKLLVPN